MPGLFITLEGGDGVGKTTQSQLLVKWLEDAGHTVVVTREPGGTDLGLELREIVLHRRGEMDPRAEALIYAADRAHHIATLVRPALERGEIVVQDRYIDSSEAYQGAGRVLGSDEVRELSLWATQNLLPDVTVLLDLDSGDSRKRLDNARTRYDRLEAEKQEFHTRVRDAFLERAAKEPERILVVDAARSIDEIAGTIRERIQNHLPQPA
ncbi:dTMP kinase [Salinibacterium sp. NK8237]|uniref:dTMP kinase n=1 Tax=Salinibacterium sp. NK8237 TaxID=2792038 RepID=UPI0018CEEB47|nr:dTMP kinase [Salinibacterium sp. NK8237]MBH0131003.1 dTMP kinase [Salinibacterium sp. NK8237]